VNLVGRLLRSRVFLKLQEVFGLDLRSLALFRVGLSLLLLADLANRCADLRAHYTDAGVLPRAALTTTGAACLHALHGSAWFEAALFVVAALFAAALLVGFCTRFATVVSWFLLISLHARNPMVLQGGDLLFRTMLFWSIFLPLGARCSVDALRRGSSEPLPGRVASPCTLALILQVCFVYWFSAALKSDPVWRQEGTALYYALSIDQTVTRAGQYLLGFPRLLWFLTFATVWFEALGPVLLFCPVSNGPVRTAVVVLFLLFHLVGLNLFMALGPFPYICAVGWLALLPSWFWDRLAVWFPRTLALLQKVGRGLARRGLGTVVPGRPEEQPPCLHPSFLEMTIVTFLLVYVLCWNVRTVNFDRYSRFFPPQMNSLGFTLGLDQMWGMYAPCPLKEDGWYVVEGTLADGTRVDVLHGGGPVRWEKPELVSESYKNERWRKYMLNLWSAENAGHRPYYAAYLLREWNRHHPGKEQMEVVDVYFMLEVTLPDYQVPRPEKVLLCRYPVRETVSASPRR
jgi:hypothetical protein